MHRNGNHAATWMKTALRVFAGGALLCTLLSPRLTAQAATPTPDTSQPPEARPAPVQQVFYLHNATSQNQLNDIQTDMRNMLPRLKIYGVEGLRAISVSGTQEDVDSARMLVGELDRPLKTWRLTYTITSVENGQPAGVRHVSLLATAGARPSTFQQGSKVPIVTAAKEGDVAGNSQIQFIDVGLKIQASLDEAAGLMTLHSKVEESSLSDEKVAAPAPVLREAVLDANANLAEGKPQVLGSIEVPGSTKNLEISVAAEAVN